MASAAPSPHPRVAAPLERIEAQAAALEEALERDRLHHAWLLTGPQGVGKAGFAYRAARRLLGARPDTAFGPLGAAPDDPVSRMVAARSHPDLLVLERHVEDGPARRSIPVDEARRLPEFFSKAPGVARRRVAIIDAADDLNPNAANAVLKTLEEPSGHGVLLLVSHAPGRLLPTIRSRCRRLAFAPWPLAALAAFASARLGVEDADAESLATMAHGAPGRLLGLAQGSAGAFDTAAAEMVAGAQADVDALRIADGLRGGEGASARGPRRWRRSGGAQSLCRARSKR
jgi:DNA polymerase-3 subunit delta'